MGILQNILGPILGGGSQQGDMLNNIMQLLGDQQSGGLPNLVEQFSQKGLGDIIRSWISTGQNLPITPEQLQHGLGKDMINQLASKAGVSPDEISSSLSQLLPRVIDKLTPDGRLPQGDIMTAGKDLLKDFMK